MRRWFMSIVLALLTSSSLIACGKHNAGTSTNPPPVPPPTATARPANEVVAGSGRIQNGNVSMDVQVGHAVVQSPTRSDTATLQGAAAVKK